MPIFARINDQNRAELKAKFYKHLRIVNVVFLLVCIGLLAGAPLAPLVFGEEYEPSVVILMILSPYVFMVGNSIFTGLFLNYTGKATMRAINRFVTIVLNIILNYFFIKRWGALGAAIATSVSYLPYMVLNLLETRKVFKARQK